MAAQVPGTEEKEQRPVLRKRIVRTDIQVPSLVYGRWVEKRFEEFSAGLKKYLQDAAEQNRRAIAEDPSKTAEILQKGATLAEDVGTVADDFYHHTSCVRSARRGKLCCVEDLLDEDDGAESDAFHWIPPKRHPACPPTHLVAYDSKTLKETSRAISGEVLEIWERKVDEDHNDNAGQEAGRRQESPRLVLEGKRQISTTVVSRLNSSIVQDQMRMWMAVVRRRWDTKAQVPNLPSELFSNIATYLRPIASVILNPMYLASVAQEKRARDLEKLLEAGLAHCFEAAHNLFDNTFEADGEVSWSKNENDVREEGNTIFTIKLAGKYFSVEGEDMWPSKSEEQLVSSQVWEEKRQTEMKSSDPFVRPSATEAKYDNIVSVLRTFFEAKGLQFTQDEDERQKFTISWAP
ncbi:unnamed protein product [Amoebophrya sp. A120]|nr:unnamed protein product [Amoebophrya sp. A120]|eukprot:GSA120T00003212001.1